MLLDKKSFNILRFIELSLERALFRLICFHDCDAGRLGCESRGTVRGREDAQDFTVITGLFPEFADRCFLRIFTAVDESGGKFNREFVDRRAVLAYKDQAIGGFQCADYGDGSGAVLPCGGFPRAYFPLAVFISEFIQQEPFPCRDLFACDSVQQIQPRF